MPPAITYRIYRPRDRDGVLALWHTVFPDTGDHNVPEADLERKLASQPDLLMVAVRGDAVVGTAMAGWDGHRGWLYRVAVDPAERRRGVGRGLVEHAERTLAALGCHKLNLQIRAGNEGVVAFYRKLGYRVEARVSMGKRLG